MHSPKHHPLHLFLVAVTAACIEPPGDETVAVSQSALLEPVVDDPETKPAPTLEAPLKVRIVDRGADRVEIAWADRTSLETGNGLQRRQGTSGSWTTIASWGPLSGTTSYVNTGLSSDTLYCYRVRTYDATTSKYSGVRCAYTEDSVSRPVYWAQLELKTANVSDAGTDDHVNVRLNAQAKGATATSTTYVPSGNNTWLDYDENDFERGQTAVYEIAAPPQLADITNLTLEKRGTDAWCVERIRLILNQTDNDAGVTVFERTFGATSTTCHWLDEGDGHQPVLTIPHSELRGSASWTAARTSWTCNVVGGSCGIEVFPLQIETFRRRLEAIVGHTLHFDDRAYWAPPPIAPFPDREGLELSYVDPFTFHVKIHLKAEVWGENPSIDLDGDLHLVAEPAAGGTRVGFEMDTIESSVDVGLLTEVLLGGACFALTAHPGCFLLGQAIEAYLEGKIEDGFAPISQSSVIPMLLSNCVVLRANDDDIRTAVASCNDLDVDGMDDAWERAHGLDPNHDADASQDLDGDGLTNLQEFGAGTDPHCQVLPGDAQFCTLCGPCEPGEGDCDSDDECRGAYICRQDVGASYGLPANWDICECPVPENDAQYCTLCGPCAIGTGDCDHDDECAGTAVCAFNVGATYGLPAEWDICECGLDAGHPDYCRECGPCGLGEGDCDGDAECDGPALRCVDNAGERYGLPAEIDVCECRPGFKCGLLPIVF